MINKKYQSEELFLLYLNKPPRQRSQEDVEKLKGQLLIREPFQKYSKQDPALIKGYFQLFVKNAQYNKISQDSVKSGLYEMIRNLVKLGQLNENQDEIIIIALNSDFTLVTTFDGKPNHHSIRQYDPVRVSQIFRAQKIVFEEKTINSLEYLFVTQKIYLGSVGAFDEYLQRFYLQGISKISELKKYGEKLLIDISKNVQKQEFSANQLIYDSTQASRELIYFIQQGSCRVILEDSLIQKENIQILEQIDQINFGRAGGKVNFKDKQTNQNLGQTSDSQQNEENNIKEHLISIIGEGEILGEDNLSRDRDEVEYYQIQCNSNLLQVYSINIKRYVEILSFYDVAYQANQRGLMIQNLFQTQAQTLLGYIEYQNQKICQEYHKKVRAQVDLSQPVSGTGEANDEQSQNQLIIIPPKALIKNLSSINQKDVQLSSPQVVRVETKERYQLLQYSAQKILEFKPPQSQKNLKIDEYSKTIQLNNKMVIQKSRARSASRLSNSFSRIKTTSPFLNDQVSELELSRNSMNPRAFSRESAKRQTRSQTAGIMETAIKKRSEEFFQRINQTEISEYLNYNNGYLFDKEPSTVVREKEVLNQPFFLIKEGSVEPQSFNQEDKFCEDIVTLKRRYLKSSFQTPNKNTEDQDHHSKNPLTSQIYQENSDAIIFNLIKNHVQENSQNELLKLIKNKSQIDLETSASSLRRNLESIRKLKIRRDLSIAEENKKKKLF